MSSNALEYLDTLDTLISRAKYSLISQITFIVWIADNHFKMSDREHMGMNLTHSQLIAELRAFRDEFSKLDIKGLFIDRLDDLTDKLEYHFTTNSSFIAYVVNNELEITRDKETGLFFQKDTIEDELTAYSKELYSYIKSSIQGDRKQWVKSQLIKM